MDVLKSLIGGVGCCLLIAGCAGTVGSKERPALPLPPAKRDCALCHLDQAKEGPGALKQRLSELCLSCHTDRQAPTEHQVGMVPSMQVKDLPLVEGKMTCVTCHDPHANRFGALLRKPETELCLSCHPY